MQIAVPLLLNSKGSHNENAMDLDLSGSEESQLMHHTWLFKLRLDINTMYKALHCLGCWTALLPNGLKPHHKKLKIKLAKGDVERVNKMCEKMGVMTDYDNTPMPPIEGIPVEGLQIILKIVEVLSVPPPPLFLLDYSQSCGFLRNFGRIYQPNFHSCHRIVSFQYLHWNGPQSGHQNGTGIRWPEWS